MKRRWSYKTLWYWKTKHHFFSNSLLLLPIHRCPPICSPSPPVLFETSENPFPPHLFSCLFPNESSSHPISDQIISEMFPSVVLAWCYLLREAFISVPGSCLLLFSIICFFLNPPNTPFLTVTMHFNHWILWDKVYVTNPLTSTFRAVLEE